MTTAIPRLLCPELVGRDTELATIGEIVGSVASGKSAALLLTAEAGMGKTALLARTLEIARRAGLRALRADCVRLELARPFGPFVDLVSAAGSAVPAIREALALAPSAPGTLAHTSEDRYRAFITFARAFGALADDRTLVVGIDDLQWADDSSLELFAYLARRLRKATLLVGTYRSEELAARRPLRRMLADIPRDRAWELPLRPLSPTELSRALRLTLGPTARIAPRARESLQKACAGNPLLLEEILRALARRGELIREDGVWRLGAIDRIPLPVSVGEAVAERLRAFDDRSRAIITLAAIVGDRFDLEVLRRAADADADVVGAIREAMREQLVVEDSGAGGTFAFRHALIREAVLSDLLEPERRALHLKVTAALETAGASDDVAGALAYHFDAAGDRERAFAYHVRAAQYAARRRAPAESKSHYERALELAPDDDRIVAELSMGIALHVAVAMDRAVPALLEAIRRYERTGDARKLAHALLLRRTWIFRHLVEPLTEAEAIAERVHALLDPLGDTPELAWLLASEAAGPPREMPRTDDAAVENGERAVAMAERAGSGWHQAVALWHLSRIQWARGETQRAIDRLRQAAAIIALAPENGRQRMDNLVASDLLSALRQSRGDPEEIRIANSRVRELAEAYGVGQGDQIEFHELLYRPDWDGLALLHEDLRLTFEDTYHSAHMAIHRAFVDVARAGPAAVSDARAGLARLLVRGDVTDPGTTSAAEVALIAGEPRLALEVLEPAAPYVERPSPFFVYLTPPAVLALVAANDAGDDDATSRWLARAEWDAFAPPLAWSPFVARVRGFVDAERAWRRGDLELAIGAMAQALGERGTLGGDPFLWYIAALHLVERAAEAGSDALARRTFATVVGFYRSARATWYLERLRERADRIGIAFPSEAPASSPLTARELEIATLVASGLTNRQIAERLTLSVRTAESHVERIRSKLGFRTRAQIASWATETYGRPG